MFCKHCGAQQEDNVLYCTNCGQALTEPVRNTAEPTPAPSYASAFPTTPPVTPQYSAPATQIPPEYQPLGAWAYFGLSLLFSIPIVGFIFLIVFSCNGSNINRRNFARSYWCWLVIVLVIYGILLAAGVSLFGALGASSYY